MRRQSLRAHLSTFALAAATVTAVGVATPLTTAAAAPSSAGTPSTVATAAQHHRVVVHRRLVRQRAIRQRALRHRAAEIGRVIAVASRQRGKPYRYGADGPGAFDCSGLVRYVYSHVGRSLPHNAAAQYRSVIHISRSQLSVGDLVFDDSHGSIYHVGIYVGHGRWWAAPHTGTHVQRQRIDRVHHVYGRVFSKDV